RPADGTVVSPPRPSRPPPPRAPLVLTILDCVGGAVDVVCNHGNSRKTSALHRRNQALLVPPGLWNIVEFRQNESVLIVLCDRVYEAHDYIRDYGEFLSYRESIRV